MPPKQNPRASRAHGGHGGRPPARGSSKVAPAPTPTKEALMNEEKPVKDEVDAGKKDDIVDMNNTQVDTHMDNAVEADEEDTKRQEQEALAQTEAEEVEEKRLEEDRRARRHATPCPVNPENFNVREFNTNMAEFIRTLEQPRFNMVDREYPVEELSSVVGLVTQSVQDYKVHTTDSQRQLETLTDAMSHIRENLHFSVSRQAMDMRTDGDVTQQELDLHARAAQLTAMLARANADVTEAIKLSTEAESVAVQADMAAEAAREETKRVQIESQKKEEAEEIQKRKDKKRMEDAKKKLEESAKKESEDKQKKEDEWKRRQASEKNANTYDSWPEVAYEFTNESGEQEVTCVIRGNPANFSESDVTCRRAAEKEALVTYLPNDELISHVINLEGKDGEQGEKLNKPIYVAIPHLMTRASASSREPVVKAMMEGAWVDLPTKDISLDSKKDHKFAQAEVHTLTTLVVMSRFKRDYVTLPASRAHKVTSSFDQRITFALDKGTFDHQEHFLLEVQPIDPTTMQDFKVREPLANGLLSTSAIINTTWEAAKFMKPVQVNLSCPPNPAKAKKLAAARKAKEEKMKNPRGNMVVPDWEAEKAKEEREKNRMQSFLDENGEMRPKATKWYMGQYANTEDDETDQLHFLYVQAGMWKIDPKFTFKQVKVDVISFQLATPLERYMVVRTRPGVSEDNVVTMVTALNNFLTKKFVEAVVRQRADDPFAVALHVTPLSRVEAAMKTLELEGYEAGPAPSHVVCLHEGDVLELGFSGNIECKENIEEQIIFKTNVPTVTHFRVTEENKFRQKDQGYFSGMIVLSRTYVAPVKKGKKAQDDEGDLMEVIKERLCTLQINIPKYHIEPNSEPKRAPVTLRTTSDPVDNDLLMTVAEGLGSEWKTVAYYLGLRRARVQAILRNMSIGEHSEKEAKYDMLISWLKTVPKGLDKVASLTAALKHSERPDLAEAVQERGRDYLCGRSKSRMTRQATPQMTPVN